jgi:hypothetical protein
MSLREDEGPRPNGDDVTSVDAAHSPYQLRGLDADASYEVVRARPVQDARGTDSEESAAVGGSLRVTVIGRPL